MPEIILPGQLIGVFLLAQIVLFSGNVLSAQAPESLATWNMKTLLEGNGEQVFIDGDPSVAASANAVIFNGRTDRILVKSNPISGADEFAIEMEIFPYAPSTTDNKEPRILHLVSDTDQNRWVTLELRFNANREWYLDAFIKSNNERLALINPAFVHPIEQWHHVAMTYKKGILNTYVNGKFELSGVIQYTRIKPDAKVSIGARMNRVHWFNGKVRAVSFSKTALVPKHFMLLQMNSGH